MFGNSIADLFSCLNVTFRNLLIIFEKDQIYSHLKSKKHLISYRITQKKQTEVNISLFNLVSDNRISLSLY